MNIQKIFFSYSRNDASTFASQLATDLGKAGFDVWIDQQDISAGLEWDLEIEKALDSCDCLLFIESQMSVTSNNVLDEVYYALGQDKKVIPVIYHDSKTPFRLQRLQHIDLSKDYQAGLALLIKELKATTSVGEKPEQAISPVNQPATRFSRKYTRSLVGATILILAIATAFLYFSNRKDKISPPGATMVAADTAKELNVNETAPPAALTESASIEKPPVKKTTISKAEKVKPVNVVKRSPLITTDEPAKELPATLIETFEGNWQLISVDPKPASHRGYLKIEPLDEKRVKLLSSFQFYFKRTNAEAQFVVFNGFASCASCTLKKEMKIIENDIAFGTNRYTILKEDTDEGKAGDTTATMGGNSSISAQVTLLLRSENSVIIKVEQRASTPISHGFIVPPFVYTFHFTKKS